MSQSLVVEYSVWNWEDAGLSTPGVSYFLPRKNSTFSNTTIQQSQMHAVANARLAFSVLTATKNMFIWLILGDYSYITGRHLEWNTAI